MLQVNMPGAFRHVFGKGESRRLRMNNVTPGVVYSDGNEALAVQFDAKLLYKSLYDIHGQNAVITIKVDGDDKAERHALIKEIQKNPVTDQLIHVDFHEIDLEQPKEFKVPLKYKGPAKGVDLGGDLFVARNSIKLRGCPMDIPDYVEVDITSLGRGDKLRFKDIAIPEKIDMLEKDKTLCVSVS